MVLCMQHKQCFKCHQTLSLDQFYRHPQMPDGHVNKCKECNKKDVQTNRLKNLEYYRDYDIKRSKTPIRRANVARVSNRWKKKHPDRHKAHNAVSNAVRDGRLTRPKYCENCGEEKRLHGHHDDYSMRLDVMWLCVPCHHARHKELNSQQIELLK